MGMLGWLRRRGLGMKGLITMDDLTNEDILSILDDASRLLPVARGETYLPLLEGKILGNLFFEVITSSGSCGNPAMVCCHDVVRMKSDIEHRR